MKLGRFIVDTHVHSQRHAAGKTLKGSTDFKDLGHAMHQIEAYDNTPRLIYDMDCYGVDMCVIEPAFGIQFWHECRSGAVHGRHRLATIVFFGDRSQVNIRRRRNLLPGDVWCDRGGGDGAYVD